MSYEVTIKFYPTPAAFPDRPNYYLAVAPEFDEYGAGETDQEAREDLIDTLKSKQLDWHELLDTDYHLSLEQKALLSRLDEEFPWEEPLIGEEAVDSSTTVE